MTDRVVVVRTATDRVVVVHEPHTVVGIATPAAGPIGPTGPPGPDGPPGPSSIGSWFEGDGPPPIAILGAEPGDMYYDRVGHRFYQLT